MVADELRLLIRAETSKAVREMKKAQRGMDRTHRSSQTLVKNLLKQGAAWAAAAVSVRAVVSVVKSSVTAFREQEEATRALDAAVERNPLLDGDAAESLKAFSDSLSSVTTVSDQTIDSLIAQAAASGKNERQIRQMITAAVDMASVMDMDVQQAFDNLLGTFTGTAGELEDFVPSLSEMSEESLKAGDAVNVLAREFDGAAEAIAKTESGQLQQFQNSLVDLGEALGEQVLQNINGLLSGLTGISSKIADIIEQNNEMRALRSGGAADTGEISERQYQEALSVTEEINARIAQKEEERNRIVDQREAYRAANMDTMAAQLAIQEQQLTNQLRGLQNDKEDAAWAFRTVEAYERQKEEQDEAAENAEDSQSAMEGAAVATAKWGDNLGGVKTLLSSVGNDVNTVGRMWDTLTTESVAANAIAVEEVEEATEEAKKTAADYINMASMGFSSLSGVVSAYAQLERQELEQTMAKYDERMEKLEEQHERQLEFAKARGASEQELTEIREQQEKEKEKLEEQKEKERKKAEKKAFKREKAMNIAETTMAGAQAFVQALTAGPVAGPILASAIAGMTAAQLSLISQQQYPGLASGGIVPAQGEGGGLYRLGDKNKAETVLPFDIRQAGGMGSTSVVFNGPVNAYGAGGVDELAETIDRSIRRQQKTGAIPA